MAKAKAVAKTKTVTKTAAAVSPEAALVTKFLAVQAKSKAVFRLQCDMKAELLALLARSPAARIPLGDGRTLVRTDNFASKNTHYKQTAVDRFEITIEGDVLPELAPPAE